MLVPFNDTIARVCVEDVEDDFEGDSTGVLGSIRLASHRMWHAEYKILTPVSKDKFDHEINMHMLQIGYIH